MNVSLASVLHSSKALDCGRHDDLGLPSLLCTMVYEVEEGGCERRKREKEREREREREKKFSKAAVIKLPSLLLLLLSS